MNRSPADRRPPHPLFDDDHEGSTFAALPMPWFDPADFVGPWLPARGPSEVVVRVRAGSDGAPDEAVLGRVREMAGGRAAERLAERADSDGLWSVKVRLDNGLSVDEAMNTLGRLPGVATVEPDWTVSIQAISNDDAYENGSLWGMYGDRSPLRTNGNGSQAGEAWDAGHTGSTKTVLGVIDTGIDYTHPDLYLNIWLNQGEIALLPFRGSLSDVDTDGLITFRDLNATANASYVTDRNGNQRIDAGDLLADSRWENGTDDDRNGRIDDLIGWDFVNGDNDPFDDQGHGTHVSGTIGGLGGNDIGVAGVNWSIQLVALKFLGANGSGSTSGAIGAVDYFTNAAAAATARGSTEHFVGTSNSWGGGGFSTALDTAILDAARQDLLFIAAAGNETSNNDTTANYPSNYSTLSRADFESVIAVASITSSGGLSSFSNYGATTVDLGAPGSGILSTVPGGGYATYSGTSMATPHVAGAVALFASVHPDATAAEIRGALLSSTAATASLASNTVTGGRLDVTAMLQAGPVDSAPWIVSGTPADGGWLPAFEADLVLRFSETVSRGIGEIRLREGSATGAIVERFDAATSGRLTLSGDSLRLDPTLPLAGDRVWHLDFDEGSFVDAAGNPLAAVSSYDFRTDDHSEGIGAASRIATESQTAAALQSLGDRDWFVIDLVAGRSYVFELNGTGTTPLADPFLSLFDAGGRPIAQNDDSALGGLGSRLVHIPSSSGTFHLEAKAYGDGHSGGYTLNAVEQSGDFVAPTALEFSPADGATNVARDANITVTFSEPVVRGSGNIQLRSGSATGTVVETFSDGRMQFDGGTLTIDPSVTLSMSTTYFVTFAAGSVRDLAGNAFAGTTGYDFRTGLTGTSGSDSITGTSGNDLIFGFGGDDLLTGAAGSDTIDGGDGNDLFIVANASHLTSSERILGGDGIDELRFTATSSNSSSRLLSLGANLTDVEKVVIGTGTGAIATTTGTTTLYVNASAVAEALTLIGNNGTNQLAGTAYGDLIQGNGGNDTLTGNAGDDVIHGGLGNDSLLGGAGTDVFVFDTLPNSSSNRDLLPDFNVSDDTLRFIKSAYPGLSVLAEGTLPAGSLRTGNFTTAGDADDRFVYNTSTGVLYYDADGSGSGASPIQVALIGTSSARPLLTHLDFEVTG